MVSRCFRIFVTLTTFVVAWLAFGRTAEASTEFVAPLCDPRGAVVLAGPPQIQALEMSLDIVTNDDDCTESPMDTRFVAPGSPTHAELAASSQPPLNHASSLVSIRPMVNDRLPAPVAMEVISRPGFRDSLERPPRA